MKTQDTIVTLSKGGTNERKVKLSTIHIPDLWHVASEAGPVHAPAIREVWHIAHDLKRELLEREAEHAALVAVAEQANVVSYSLNATQSTGHWSRVSTMQLHLLLKALANLAAVRGQKEVAK